ncbi:UTRA domain-containing protein [Actinomadura sp. 6N118]|uniref:UTRA domain-containing protein n=1 Tax=Actinomadura sp. 6N118 TaxID=3375151 RepID=UPI0037A92096
MYLVRRGDVQLVGDRERLSRRGINAGGTEPAHRSCQPPSEPRETSCGPETSTVTERRRAVRADDRRGVARDHIPYTTPARPRSSCATPAPRLGQARVRCAQRSACRRLFSRSGDGPTGLEESGCHAESFYTRMPARAEIDVLQLPAGEPVMILQRRTFTREGRIVEFARGVHAASRFAWSYSFKIPE